MSTVEGQPPRYHAFDALRGAMMLLGVVLHSATAYATFPGVWWLKDPATTRVSDLMILVIHVFRLPAFFVMSGFFAALLFGRRGWQGFLENRACRLGLPFLLGMGVMFPFLKTVSVFAWALGQPGDPWAATRDWLARGRLEATIEPMHLWFLETLMIVCLGAAWLGPGLNRWFVGGWFRRLMGSRLVIPLWALFTFITLIPMEFGILDTPHSFAPHFRIVAAYAVFFAFGWGVYVNRADLERLQWGGWKEIALGVAVALAMVPFIDRQLAHREVRMWGPYLAVAGLNALSVWLFITGLIGLFLRRAGAASARSRYLSDSAYWVYLVHPPVLVVVQVPMFWLPVPPELKIVTGVVFAVPVLYWTYDCWVRPTWLGAILNGRKYPRWAGEGAAESEAVPGGSLIT